MKKIKLLALDIDGVLTDGSTTLGAHRPEKKRLAFQDLDAINAAKRAGLKVALVTGESDGSVDLVAARTGVELVIRGAKDKLAALRFLAKKFHISLEEISYVGDGDRDAPALARVGFSLAPSNATFAARSSAQRLLDRRGGQGAVNEAVRLVLRLNDDQSRKKYFLRELGKAFRKKKISHKALEILSDLAVELTRAVESGRKILLYGKGAEAYLARFSQGQIAWPVLALSSNLKTQGSQLKALVRPGDVKVMIAQPGAGKTHWVPVIAVAEKYLRKNSR